MFVPCACIASYAIVAMSLAMRKSFSCIIFGASRKGIAVRVATSTVALGKTQIAMSASPPTAYFAIASLTKLTLHLLVVCVRRVF